LDRKAPRLQDDAQQDLCQFAGKVVLIVNTASYCGYTQQYEGLEALHKRYSGRGLVVLGFPSNDFGQQEPGSAKQIADLCFNTYGVAFPMFAKTVVAGPGADPLFAELARASGSPPKWNFHKWLVGRDGRIIAAYPSAVAPLDPLLIRDVERSVAR
jgi:glutathione peroxidase